MRIDLLSLFAGRADPCGFGVRLSYESEVLKWWVGFQFDDSAAIALKWNNELRLRIAFFS